MSSTLSLPPGSVAVFDADAPTAIAFTRSLGSQGVTVHVYAPARLSAAGQSRFAAESRRCPPLDHAGEFLPWLEQRFRTGEIEAVAPTSDLVAFYLAELDDLLPRRLARALPRPLAVRQALFKDSFHEALAARKCASPRTVAPVSLDDAIQQAQELRFPLVLKPKAHVGAGPVRGQVLFSLDELQRSFAPWPEDESNRLVFARYPQLRLPMLQEYVPGALQHLYSVSGILGPDGAILAVSGSRKTAQWPPSLGVGVHFEPWVEPRMLAQGSELARSMLGTGIFELEYIWDDRRREYLAIDLNPRAHGQIMLDMARGHDLPAVWWRMLQGQELMPLGPADPSVQWRHAIPFHVGHAVHLLQGPDRLQTWQTYRNAWRQKAVDIVYDRADPMPGVVYTGRMLRHPGGLVRPFLRANDAVSP